MFTCFLGVRFVLFISSSFMYGLHSSTDLAEDILVSDQIKIVRNALEFVKSIDANTCKINDVTNSTLTLDVDHNAWMQYADTAVKTANFLNAILALDGNLSRFHDDVFYALVRNNVHGSNLIFGSAIALEPEVVEGKEKFCSYACWVRANNTIKAFDIAVNYDYRTNSTSWYRLQTMDTSNITLVIDQVNLTTENVFIQQAEVVYSDGRWTFPYFDCGGGNIWMSTFSAPIIYVSPDGGRKFRGVATIDIELTKLDINQCNRTENETAKAFDIFRGTHSCQATTTCVPLLEGFRAGAYNCACLDGYYFPNTSATLKAFSGKDIEEYFEMTNSSSFAPQFQCLQCPRACDTCVDATPCLYEVSHAVQALVVVIMAIMIIAIILVSVAIVKNKKQLVIKTASPIFLQIMCFGAVLMCCSVFALYGEVTTATCTIQIWLFHLGFAVTYGALLIKTWRISVIFKSGGATKRVNLPDKALFQRMLPLVAVIVIYLAVWTALNPPLAITEKTSNGLKFFTCNMSWWTYAMFGVEVLMLLVGVYLCFTVRKAPAHFNESKFITWATYNAIILGCFIIILTQFIGVSAGPDIVFVLMMAQQQVFVTITMGLIFMPKFWTLYKGVSGDSVAYSNQVMTITGRVKPALTPTTSKLSDLTENTKSIGIQCSPESFFSSLESKENESAFNKQSSSLGTRSSTDVLPLHSTNLKVPEINGINHHLSSNA